VINGQQYLLIKLDKGKTGRRTIVCRHSVRKYLDRIKDRFENLKGKSFNQLINVEDYVFRLRDGSVPKDLHGAFKIMLRKAELLDDVNGNRRSLYSLRHTYATFQILYSKIDLHTLAKNMGTSIAMLERHYSHLEVIHKAELLAGRTEAKKGEKHGKKENTKILLVDGNLEDFGLRQRDLLDQIPSTGGEETRKSQDTGQVG
jgi:integrase